MKFSIKDFFSQCDQINNFLRIWSHLLKKSLTQNFIFCVVKLVQYFMAQSFQGIENDIMNNCLIWATTQRVDEWNWQNLATLMLKELFAFPSLKFYYFICEFITDKILVFQADVYVTNELFLQEKYFKNKQSKDFLFLRILGTGNTHKKFESSVLEITCEIIKFSFRYNCFYVSNQSLLNELISNLDHQQPEQVRAEINPKNRAGSSFLYRIFTRTDENLHMRGFL